MIAQKRDINEQELIKLWRGVGCVVIPMDKSAGFDLLVIHRGEVHIVEIKDGEKRWRLTPHEREVCTQLGAVNVPYSIVTNRREALELIGAEE